VWLYQRNNSWQCARACSIEVNRAGKYGRYFKVLNGASENGLPFGTCGRLRDWVMPRSASRKATGREVIEDPRSPAPEVQPGSASASAVALRPA
jgi:hypothetical protein